MSTLIQYTTTNNTMLYLQLYFKLLVYMTVVTMCLIVVHITSEYM